MRFISSLLVAILAATTLTTSLAAACGGYVRVDPAPQVLTVSTHGVMAKEHWTNRAFVVLEQSVQLDDDQWTPLAPGTYDGTRIAILPSFYVASEFTLVGPSGARVVKAQRKVALSRSWQIGLNQSRAAFEIPIGENDQFTIALPGRVTDAKWREIGYAQAPASTSWWLAKQGIKDAEYVAIRSVPGADLEVVQFSRNGKFELIVRRGDDAVGVSTGTSIGVVTTKSRSFLVVNIDNRLGTLELPALTATATARS